MSQAIDLKDALERVQDDKELLLELFDIFLEDFPGKRDGLWKAFETGNVAQFQQFSHGLKGATGNISAAKMHVSCSRLDQMGKDGIIKDARPILEALDAQFAEFRVAAAGLKEEFGK